MYEHENDLSNNNSKRNYNINNRYSDYSYNDHDNPQETTIKEIYAKNKELNKQRIDTAEFMSYSIKVELLFQTLQGYLYWVSGLELLIFLSLFCLFCSSPKTLSKIWWYIFHLFRSIIGLLIIQNLPRTYEIIENLEDIPQDLNEVKIKLIQDFFSLLKAKKKKLKMFLMIYFGLTVLCMVIDIMMFCVFAPDFGATGKEKQFFYMILSSSIYVYTDVIYFNFFSSFKYYFNKKQQDQIQRATVLGFFDQLRIGMAKKVVKMAKKITRVTEDIRNNISNMDKINPFGKRASTESNKGDENKEKEVEISNSKDF